MRKIMIVLFSAMMGFMAGCSSQTEKNTGFSVGMVTDTGGLNDQSFNEITWKGLEKAKLDLGANIKALESRRDEDYMPNLNYFARENRQLVWAVGFKLDKAVLDAAKQYPNTRFGIVDSNLGGNVPKNALALTFKEEEGAFLMGVLAAMTTQTEKVGFIGGISSPTISKFQAGFSAGVKAVKPNVQLKIAYAESFTDTAKVRSLAQNMYNSGVDIIFHASGGAGKGLFDEVRTRQAGKYWAMGVDMDQSFLAPKHTLSSLIKRIDVAVYHATELCKNGKFPGGKVLKLGLKEGALEIAPGTKDHVNQKVLDAIEKYKEKIIKGELQVPQK